MRLNKETLDLGHELAAVKEFYEAAAQEKDIEIRVEAPPSVVGDLDRTLFQRALGNLVSNALAHTPAQGCVALRAVSEQDAIRVEVSDNGVGIAPEHLSHIFDRFYRADGARSRHFGGVGLGLAIVRTIASVHGGSAEIQSEPGHGTTVRLKLPKMTKS
jgi:two-component system heavy metal sensor histidine kinase CusS